jgi:hypothetical protein
MMMIVLVGSSVGCGVGGHTKTKKRERKRTILLLLLQYEWELFHAPSTFPSLSHRLISIFYLCLMSIYFWFSWEFFFLFFFASTSHHSLVSFIFGHQN